MNLLGFQADRKISGIDQGPIRKQGDGEGVGRRSLGVKIIVGGVVGPAREQAPNDVIPLSLGFRHLATPS